MNSKNMLKDLLGRIVRDPRLHARLTNTFSLLEYVGFRKIVKSQHAGDMDSVILTHAIEEGRHALRLKKLAIELGGPEFENYSSETMLCGAEAEDYLQALDHQCEAQFAEYGERQRRKLTYHYVTWLIERRALEVYGTYKDAIATTKIAHKVDGLIAEEEGHLRKVETEIAAADPGHAARRPIVLNIEADLYEAFINTLSGALTATAA